MERKPVRRSPRFNSNETSSNHNPQPPSLFRSIFIRTLFPLLLMLLTPNLALFFYHLTYRYGGHFRGQFFGDVHGRGPRHIINFLWRGPVYGSIFSLVVITGYITWAIVWSLVLPGKVKSGPVSPAGYTPRYKSNGLLYYFLTIFSFLLLQYILNRRGLSVTIIMDHLDELLRTLNFFAIILCIFLYIKGRWFPSGRDSGASGNPLFDFYWGLELYPRVGGLHIKLLTNCRVGMMSWALLVLVHVMRSWEMHATLPNSMAISAALQLLYITKFFHWEIGYLRTMDIAVDRAGYYICWGCLVWIPGFYTLPSQYLIKNPYQLSSPVVLLIVTVGIVSLAVNYLADDQKGRVRERGGQCKVWGRQAKFIRAHYQSDDGKYHESLLLTSGYWGLARHFHYLPELVLAFSWAVPALFYSLLPFLYPLFLTVLLVHRTYRDEMKCSSKYGIYWRQYKDKVPYKIIPYIY